MGVRTKVCREEFLDDRFRNINPDVFAEDSRVSKKFREVEDVC
jgi:hypothetical protein